MGLNAAPWVGTIGCALVLIAGCRTGPVGSADAGPRIDTGPVAMPVLTGLPGVAIDIGCLGTATLPAAGDPVSGSLHIYEFLSNGAVTGNAIDVFSDNVIVDACNAPNCQTLSTDASGNVALTRPASAWFAYRLTASGQTAPVNAYNQAWVAAEGGEVVGPAFAPSTIAMVGRLVGRTFQADRLGSMSGRVQDCAGHTLSNVRLRVFVGDVEVLDGPAADTTAALIGGLEGTQLTRNRLTGGSGNFVGANIPPGEDCHVEAWAVLHDGGEAELFGCTEGRVVVGGITVSLVTPLRADYAAGSRCALAAAAAGH